MLRPRLIPFLLYDGEGLVKTRRFADPKYVGDPINAVRIFNEKLVDELVFLDINATVQRREPQYDLIAALAAECRMPLCYGGGISSVEQIERIVSLGVEKVAVGAAAVKWPALVEEAARRVGSQSIVAVLDVRRTGVLRKRYEIFTARGTKPSGLDPGLFAKELAARGVGEIVINSIDSDGCMEGYDLECAHRVRSETSIPLTIVGGAGNLQHVQELWQTVGIAGAGAGSLFVFKGSYRAVLINYPTSEEKDLLIQSIMGVVGQRGAVTTE